MSPRDRLSVLPPPPDLVHRAWPCLTPASQRLCVPEALGRLMSEAQRFHPEHLPSTGWLRGHGRCCGEVTWPVLVSLVPTEELQAVPARWKNVNQAFGRGTRAFFLVWGGPLKWGTQTGHLLTWTSED